MNKILDLRESLVNAVENYLLTEPLGGVNILFIKSEDEMSKIVELREALIGAVEDYIKPSIPTGCRIECGERGVRVMFERTNIALCCISHKEILFYKERMDSVSITPSDMLKLALLCEENLKNIIQLKIEIRGA